MVSTDAHNVQLCSMASCAQKKKRQKYEIKASVQLTTNTLKKKMQKDVVLLDVIQEIKNT